MSGKKQTTPLQNIINGSKPKYGPSYLQGITGTESSITDIVGLSNSERASSEFQSGLSGRSIDSAIFDPQERFEEEARNKKIQASIQKQQQELVTQKTKEIAKINEDKNSIQAELKKLDAASIESKEINKIIYDPKSYKKINNPLIPTNTNALGVPTADPISGQLTPEAQTRLNLLKEQQQRAKAPLLENFNALKKKGFEEATVLKQTQGYLQKVKRIEDLEGKSSAYGKNFSESKSDYDKSIEEKFGKTGIMSYVGKGLGAITKGINNLVYTGAHAVSSPESKMSKEERQEYLSLKQEVKTIEKPYLEGTIEELKTLKEQAQNTFNKYKTSWGSAEEEHKTYAMMAMDRALEEAESALNDDSGASIFARELSKLTIGKNGLMEDAQRSLNEYWRYDDLVKKEAKVGFDKLSPIEQESLKLYSRARQLEESVAEQQSFGYKTVKGTMGSVGFVRDMWLGARGAKLIGGLFNTTRSSMALSAATKTLKATGSPLTARTVAGVVRGSSFLGEQALVTYINPRTINERKNKGSELTVDQKGKVTDFLTREELYEVKEYGLNKERIRLQGIKKMLESQTDLSEEDAFALKQIKSRLGEGEEIEGIPSLDKELSMYKPESDLEANLRGIGDTTIESLSELYTRKMFSGIGKLTKAGITKLSPRAGSMITRGQGGLEKFSNNVTGRFYNTGVGRGYKNWQSLVGKLNINDTKVIGSVFEEQLEEYTAAVGHSLFDWNMDDINQTFSYEGSRDIAAQTMLMNTMFGLGGNVQLHSKLRYNTLYNNRLNRMNKKVAELENFVKENPDDADGKKALTEYKTQLEQVKSKSSLGVLDPTGLISRDKTGFSATRKYIDDRKQSRAIIDSLRYASKDEDINTAIDVATLSTLGAADKESEAQVLEAKGKKEEAALIKKSMFNDILFKSFASNTQDELEAGLKVAKDNKKLSSDKKQQLTKMYDAVVELRELKEKYEKNGAKPDVVNKAVALSYGIIAAKEEIQETKNLLTKNTPKAMEVVNAFAQSKGIDISIYSMEELGTQEFSDSKEQQKYDDFIDSLYELQDSSVIAQLDGVNQLDSLQNHITSSIMARTDIMHPSIENKNSQTMLEELSKEAQNLFQKKDSALKLKNLQYDSNGDLIQSRELVAELYDAMAEKWIGSTLDGKISRATFEKLKNKALQSHDLTEQFKKMMSGMSTTDVVAAAEEVKSNEIVPPIQNMPEDVVTNMPLTDGVAQDAFDDIVQSSPIFDLPEQPEPVFSDSGTPINFTINLTGNASPNVNKTNEQKVAEYRAEEQVKKADIERRRQEELNSELDKKAKDIPIKKEYYKDNNGNDITVTTYRAGNKTFNFTESNSKAADNFEDLDLQSNTPYKTEEVESKLAKKINAKYDAEQDQLYKEYDKLISPLLPGNQNISSEGAIIVSQDDFEDFMLGSKMEYSKEQEQLLIEFVTQIASPIAMITGQDVSLTMAFEQFFRSTDRKEDAVKRMAHFINGWKLAGFKIEDNEILNLANKFNNVTSRAKLEQDFFESFGETIANVFTQPLGKNQSTGIDDTIETSKEVNSEIQTVTTSSFMEENAVTPTVKVGVEDTEEGKTNVIKPKVGFSAMSYENITLDNGVVVKRTVGDFLNIIKGHPLGLDFRPLLHPDNGPTMTLGIQKVNESTWSQIPVSIGLDERGMPILDENGQTKLVSFTEWISINKSKPNFQELFDNKVPYVFTYKGTVVGFVHEVDWYNPSSVAHPFVENMKVEEMDAEWAAHIQAGKDATAVLRKNISAGLTEVTATIPTNIIYHTLDESESLITIRESNPQAIMTVQIGVDGKLEGLDPGFNTGDKVLLNSKDGLDAINANTSGHTWVVHRVGTQINSKTGKKVETYRAVKVNRFITQDQLTSMQWAIAAHKVLNGQTVPKEFGLTKDQAENIRKDLRSIMGLNISKADDLAAYIQHFVKLTQGALADWNSKRENYQAKDVNDKIAYMNILLEQNLTFDQINQLVDQNTSKRGISLSNKFALVSAQGVQVYKDAQGKESTYKEYLMDTVYTNIKTFDMDSTGTKPMHALGIQPIISLDYTPVLETASSTTSAVQQKAEAAVQAVIAEQAQEETETFDEQAAIDYLNTLGVNLEDFEIEDFHLGDLSKISDLFQVTPGLSTTEEKPLIEEIAYEIITKLNFKSKVSDKTKGQIKEETKKQVTEKLNIYLGTLSNLLEKAKEQKNPSEKLKVIEKALAVTKINVENIIDNFEGIYTKAISEVNKQTKVDLQEDKQFEDEDDSTLVEKNYSKDSIEESLKSKASERLRMLLSGIPQFDAKGEVVKGYLGFRRFMSLNDVYNQVLKNISFGVDPESDFESLIAKLEQSASPVMTEVVARLRAADSQIKNEFVYNVVSHTLSSKFAMFEELEKGFSLKMYDTNANEITRVLKNIWKENAVASNLYNYDGTVNTEYAQALIDEFQSLPKDLNQVSGEVLKNWLSKIGMELSENTWQEIYEGKLPYKGQYVSLNTLYTQKKGGLFPSLVSFLKQAIDPQNAESHSANGEINLLSDLGGISTAIATVEAKYNPQLVSLSFRDTGKNINTQVPPKFVTDKVAELLKDARGTQEKIKELQELSFTKNSLLLQQLTDSPEVREAFGIHHTAITALKERGANVFGKNDITALGELDYDMVTTTGFSDRRVAKLPDTFKVNGFSMRMANMLFPTMSDKSTALFLTSPVFDFLKDAQDSFDRDDEGKVKTISQDVKDVLFQYLVLPEIERMHKFYSKVKATNIKGYDKAVGMFHLFPVMNTLTNADGILLKDIIKNNAETAELDIFIDQYQDIFKEAIEGVVRTEVEHKMSQWQVAKTEVGGKSVSKLFGTEYFTAKGVEADPSKDYEAGVWDYVMNSMIFNAEVFKVFAGDVSLYSQDKLFKNEIKDPTEYISINKQIGVNLGKRLALLIAPGKKIANSMNEKYNQVILKDSIDITENASALIEMYYSKEDALKAEPKLKKYSNTAARLERLLDIPLKDKTAEQIDRYYQMKAKLEEVLKDIREDLADEYKSIEAYFDIESTDAQEYTTITEHLNILSRLGRITPEDEKNILLQLAGGEDLTKEQLSLVMQPIKPVHTGTYVNKTFDVNRTVYVKSSSFPLIPQLTKGTKLDNLRNTLEKLESLTDRFTRASYQTANKVGSFVEQNAINPFDVNDLERVFNGLDLQSEGKEYTEGGLTNSVLVLNRNNFRIQQDVPFKSDKKKRDEVALGTQIFKLLFGDGVKDSANFNFKGKPVTGSELYDIYNDSFSKIVNSKKIELFRELGLSAEGRIIDEELFINSLQEVLEKEAIDRGYSIKSIRGLKMDKLQSAATGQNYYDFKTPLWLSPDSNRYESLLNSIITNRVMKHKMPGNGYVAGSESGFKFQEGLKGVEESRIIYLNGWKGKELKGVSIKDEDGKPVFKTAQVFAPSKFKDQDNKLIDLFEGFNKNTGDVSRAKYLKRNDNGTLGLKEGVLDPELLNLFSFRTPTSSHVSGSSIEIVGILPPESGDLMIVPKNFTKQKGLDYDIDKESGYQLNHIQDYKTGKIEVLDEKHLEKEMEVFNKKLEKLDFENTILEIKGKDYKFEGGGTKYAKASIYDMKNSLIERFAAILENSTAKEDIDILLDPTTSIREKKEAKKLQLERKLAENDFIRVHLAVYNSPDIEIQKKINKVLSMKFAQDQASSLEKLVEEGEKAAFVRKYTVTNPGASPLEAEEVYLNNYKNSTLLGYSYQKTKMSLGSVGKTAIGVYANYTTFNGLINQVFGEEGMFLFGGKNGGPKQMTIGNFTSTSAGLRQTIMPTDPRIKQKWLDNKYQRDTSEVWAEKENTATDNEKEQILGRVGVNEDTINVDSMISLRGFDKDENGNSISYLLLSQPVIKDYISRSKSVKGLLGKYTSKEDLINEIVKDLSEGQMSYQLIPETFAYGFIKTPAKENSERYAKATPIDWEGSEKLTGDNLLAGIRENGKNKDIQLDAFITYIELQKEGTEVASVQKVVNTNSLGKSMVESLSKQEALFNLQREGALMPYAMDLLGIATSENIPGYMPISVTKQTKDGLITSTKYFKPTTPQGQIVINGVYLGASLFKDFFPYKEPSIRKIINEIGVSENENTKIEEIETILEEIKKYLYSNPNLGVFEGDINAKRKELFVDSESNTSLARYLMTTLKSQDKTFLKGLKSLRQNPLLSRFIYEVGKGEDKVSSIKYNNSATDNLDEESLYNSLPELVENNFPLPPKNGQPYSTTELVNDLMAYSFLEGGVQEATQFVKFIPIELLEAMGKLSKSGKFLSIAFSLQGYNPKRNTNADLFENFLGIKEESVGGVSTFTKQFFQHQPQKTKKIAFKDRQNLTNNGSIFSLDPVKNPEYTVAPNFVHVKSQGITRLYMHVGNHKYQEIDILSGKGISQYQYKVDNATNVKPKVLAAPTNQPVGPTTYTVGNFKVKTGATLKSIINDVSTLELPGQYAHLSYLANWLKDVTKDTGVLQIVDKTKIAGAGATNKVSLDVLLSSELFEKTSAVEKTAEIFIHEFIHHVSIQELAKYYEADFRTIKSDAPAYVKALDNVFNTYASNLDTTKLDKFRELDAIIRDRTLSPGERKAAALERDNFEERDIYYAATNIKEFLALTLTDRSIQEKLSSMPYSKTGKSFLDVIQEFISELFSQIYPSIKEDSLAMDALKASMNFIQEEYNNRPKNSVSLPQVNPDPVLPSETVFKQPEPEFIPETPSMPEPNFSELNEKGEIVSVLDLGKKDPNYEEAYDSDINKGKKDYSLTRRRIGVKGYANVYGKKIVIPGFENFEFVMYLDEYKRYSIMEKQTGMNLPNKGNSRTIKDTLAGVQEELNKYGAEKFAEIINKTPKVYTDSSDQLDFALPVGLSQFDWESLTPAEQQKIKECN
jgi:hypothetical protein